MGHEGGVVVFGCGHWGKNIVKVASRLGALRGVYDPSEAGRSLAAEIAPDAKIYSHPEEVFADSSVRAAMVATPAETHFDTAIAAIDAGLDVFVEKPLCVNVDDAIALTKHAEVEKQILMVGHLLEYHPAFVTLRELVQAGELGRIQYLISNRLNLGKIRTEENALWSFAPHDISVILRLVGSMPFEIVATGGAYIQPNIADATVTQLLFNNGVRAHIFVSWLHPFKEQKLVVIGSEKMASYDDITKELVLYDQRVDLKEGQPIPVRGEGMPVDFPDTEPLEAEVQHFLDCIKSRATPFTDGNNGVRVLQILHAAQRSMVMNGSLVPLPSS
jgi:predicted dehydrogenase